MVAMSRATYLQVTDVNTLNLWARELTALFPDTIEQYGVYLVGAAVQRPDFRDVDVRHILSDQAFSDLEKTVDVGCLNHIVSIWGQKLTGLPIDYQVQPISSPENQGGKHPLHMFTGYVNGKGRKLR